MTTRIREPGGTGGKSSVFDPDPAIPTSRGKESSGSGGKSTVFEDGSMYTAPSGRGKESSGTGGKSTVFEDEPVHTAPSRPAQPNPLTEAPEAPVRLSTKPLQPGGTGGKSSVFVEDSLDEPQRTGGHRQPSPFATAEDSSLPPTPPVRTSAKILQPGGTGGASRVFDTSNDHHDKLNNLASPISDAGSLSGDEGRRPVSVKNTHTGVFATEKTEEEENQTWSGRKVEAGRTNMSQVALGGGYPDAEPTNRNARRGNIRTDANQSQIMFGDDTGGAPVQERSSKTTSRVLRPGGTGGSSQIAFGDDTGGVPVQDRKAGTSSRVLRPGGTGGGSQITFGDDTGGAPVQERLTKVNRPGGTGGGSQISFAHDETIRPPSEATKTSSRVLRPGGTGGTSQITF